MYIAVMSFFIIIFFLIVPATSFVSTASIHRNQFTNENPTAVFSAMEHLHDSSANRFGPVEHVYSLKDIDLVTRKIADDEWSALATQIAEDIYEMILDVSEEALHEMSFSERAVMTNEVAENVASGVEVSIIKLALCHFQIIHLNKRSRSCYYGQNVMNKMRAQSMSGSKQLLPEELLTSFDSLVCNEIATITGTKFVSDSADHDLSLLVLYCLCDSIESYFGITNINAPFFGIDNEIQNRIRSRRRSLLLKHHKGYESVTDIEKDIETSRQEWMKNNIGNKAANNYYFGEVTTKAGNRHSHQEEKHKKEMRAKLLSSLLSIHV